MKPGLFTESLVDGWAVIFFFGITSRSLGSKPGLFADSLVDGWAVIFFFGSGADPGFFLGGGALVSCSTSTPINHIVFFAEY